MKQFKVGVLVAAMGAGLALSSAAMAQSYTVLDLINADARAINDKGQTAGLTYDSTGSIALFIDANGVSTALTMPDGGTQGAALAINNLGQVAGLYQTASGETHGFYTGPNGQGVTDFVGPGVTTVAPGAGGTQTSYFTWVSAIDDTGRLAGIGPNNPFITDANGAGWRDLSPLGGTMSEANAINASGMVVGISQTAGGQSHAFITGPNGAGMTDLGTFLGGTGEAYGVNDLGQVVGYSSIDTNFTFHAFVTGLNGQGLIDLNSLITLPDGEYLTTAKAINNAGQIVAFGSLGHAVMLTPTPVPEAQTSVLMLLGLVGVGLATRRAAAVRANAG